MRPPTLHLERKLTLIFKNCHTSRIYLFKARQQSLKESVCDTKTKVGVDEKSTVTQFRQILRAHIIVNCQSHATQNLLSYLFIQQSNILDHPPPTLYNACNQYTFLPNLVYNYFYNNTHHKEF